MNQKKSIRRILREGELHLTPQELIKNLPQELKELVFKQWGAKQNPQWHPEGNTLKHILVVIKRAYHHYPDDPNMIMAALFHDLGKIDTYKINPKTGQPTAYGHEDKSTDYVEKFREWIESFDGTDVDEIKYLVKNHMKVKPSTWDQMKDKKKEPIKSHPAFDKLMGFTDKLDGGGTDLKESIRRVLREEFDNFENIDWITKSKVSLKNSVIFFNPVITKEDYDKVVDTIETICNYGELYCYTGSLRDLNPFAGYDYLHHLVITKDGKILYGGVNTTSEDSLYNIEQDLENYIINNDVDFNNPTIIDGREYFNL